MEFVEMDESQMSRSVEIQPSPTESSATSYSLFHELIDEMENNQSYIEICDPLRRYVERYPSLVPKRDEAKERKASFPQAWSMIDFPSFKASLDKADESPELWLLKLIHSFGSAFAGVSFAWEDISKDPFSSTLDVSLCPGYARLVDWIFNHGRDPYLLYDFIVWAFGHILDSLFHYRWKKGHSPTPLPDVSIFAALALVLRSRPHVFANTTGALEKISLWYQKKGAVTCPIKVWMVHQVSFANLHAALFSWVRFLLPQLQLVPHSHSREIILHLVDKIFENPGAQTQLVETPTLLHNPLFTFPLFEMLLRVTFTATSEEYTTGLLKMYTSLKKVALACVLLRDKNITRFFRWSLGLAVEGNPGLAKEALEIAVWCMKNGDCWQDLYDSCKQNSAVSVALLKTLTESDKLNLNLLPSSNKAMPDFIQQMFTVSLTLAGQGNPVLSKEAAKVSIWCLTQQDVNCWSHFRYIYTKNLEASVALLQALVDEWPALSLKLASSGKPFIQQIFTVSLGLAGEENPVEATEIAIWCLTQNVDCWTCWKNLYSKENPKASVVLLKALVEKWNVHSLELSYESIREMKLIIQEMVTCCLNIARQGISILDTLVPGNPVLLGKASAVAMWSLTEIADCCLTPWTDLYVMILIDSETLLKNLVKKCKHLSRKLASLPSLRSGTLGGAPEREAMKHVFQQIFTFSLRLSGKEHPESAEEARAISIWLLTKNFDCWTCWDNLYEENMKASVGLLKKLVEKWNDHSLKLSLSPSDTLTLSQTIKSFRLKNQKAIAEGGANAYLCKEADKFCQVVLGKLSRGCCSLKCACITSLLLAAALILLGILPIRNKMSIVLSP